MTDSDRRYKVARVANERGLADVENELVERWTTADDPASLRDLETYFNERVLETAVKDAGMNVLDGEVENLYRLLTSEDVSRGVQTETKKKLERNGIDVDQLKSDFVTYQAVRTYLKEGRDVERERSTDAERIEAAGASIAQLQQRSVAVTEKKLSQLDRTGRIDLGDFRVLLDVRVFCEDCGNQYEVRELLDRGGCRCDDRESAG
jgi:hypothetical protein